MKQVAAVLADKDVDENSSSSSGLNSTFLNVVALGNVGAGKSSVLNNLIGQPVLPTGENGATRPPIRIGLQRDGSLSSKSIILRLAINLNKFLQVSALRQSLQDRLSKGATSKSQEEIYLKLRTSTAPTLKLIDLPGLDQKIMDESMVSDYAEHGDAILLVIVPAAQAPEIASSRALRIAKEYDGEGNRTIGVISKIDQAASDQKALVAVQALLLNQGPPKTADIPWIALIGQSVSNAAVQSGSESSLETAWKAENESLKSILTGAPQSKLGRIALVDVLAQQIRKRIKVRLPKLLSGLQRKSQIVQDELVRFGEQMVQSAEGTRAIALELCREFEDKFLQEGSGWKIVASFEGNFPNRIKELPLDRHFDINNVKRQFLIAWLLMYPKRLFFCQVEKAKEDMLNQLYSSISAQSTARIEELLQEDKNVKHRREHYQKQSSLLSKLTHQLSIHDNRAAAAASSWPNGDGAERSPSKRTSGSAGDDWRSAFDAAANGAVDHVSLSRSASIGHSRHYGGATQNGDVSSRSNSSSRRTPNRLPPTPPRSGSSGYRN